MQCTNFLLVRFYSISPQMDKPKVLRPAPKSEHRWQIKMYLWWYLSFLMLEEMLLPTPIGLKGPSEWFEQYKGDLNNILWPSVTSSTQLNTYGRILRTNVFMLSTIMIKTPIEAIWCLLWSSHRESSTDLQNQHQYTLKPLCRLVLAEHLINSQMNTFYTNFTFFNHIILLQVR